MTQIILGLLKAFPSIAKVVGRAVDFYREQEAKKVYEAKLSDIDAAVNRFALRMQNKDRRNQKVNGETRLPSGNGGSTGMGESSTERDSST